MEVQEEEEEEEEHHQNLATVKADMNKGACHVGRTLQPHPVVPKKQ